WCLRLSLVVCFFFFQAEDGIRDLIVTGVQTCALPILLGLVALLVLSIALPMKNTKSEMFPAGERDRLFLGFRLNALYPLAELKRSEERRVGKECRCGWWGEQCKKECGDGTGVCCTARG